MLFVLINVWLSIRDTRRIVSLSDLGGIPSANDYGKVKIIACYLGGAAGQTLAVCDSILMF
jgi:hypothetical protein